MNHIKLCFKGGNFDNVILFFPSFVSHTNREDQFKQCFHVYFKQQNFMIQIMGEFSLCLIFSIINITIYNETQQGNKKKLL